MKLNASDVHQRLSCKNAHLDRLICTRSDEKSKASMRIVALDLLFFVQSGARAAAAVDIGGGEYPPSRQTTRGLV